MSKQGGLGARFLVGGYDISGDVNALDTIRGGKTLLDATDITQSAHSRLHGLRDGNIDFTAFMDTALAHPVLSALPVADTLMTFLVPSAAGAQAQGNAAACLVARQVGYDPTRGNDGSLLLKVAGEGDGYGLEWGDQLTAGLRADTSATAGTALDYGAGSTYGAQAYLQVTAFTGTDVTIAVQHCTTSGGSYSDLIAFTALGSGNPAPFTQRSSVSNTATVDEFVKVTTTTSAGFTSVTFSVVFVRNLVAGVVF